MNATDFAIGQALASLGDIKQIHRKLLEASDENPQDTQESVRTFIQRAAAAGRFIDSACERAEAQRLIHYWLANLPASNRSESIPIKDAILAPFDSAIQTKVTADVDDLLAMLAPLETSIVKQIFLRLACLDPDGTTFSRISRDENELLQGLARDKAKKLLERLIEKGLIVRNDRESGKLSLVDAPIFGRWTTGDRWLAQRLRYRGAVRFWRSHNEDPTALLEAGELLDEAVHFLDLNEHERAFALKSREQSGQRRRQRYLTAVMLLTVLASVYYYQQGQMAKERAAFLENSNRELANKNWELQDRIKEVEGARFDLSTTVVKWEETKKLTATDLEKALVEIRALQQSAVLISNASSGLRTASTFLRSAMNKLQPGGHTAPTASTNILRPGTEIVVQGSNSAALGTASVLLWDPATKSRYIVAPRYLIPGGAEAKLFSLGNAKGADDTTQHLASFKQTAQIGRDPNELSAIQISDHVNAVNNLPDGREFLQPVTLREATNGLEVFLASKDSEPKRGRILDYDPKSGLIRTTKISEAGDAGAVVVTKEGKPLGIVVGSYGTDQSLVKPLAPFLETNKLKVLPSSPR